MRNWIDMAEGRLDEPTPVALNEADIEQETLPLIEAQEGIESFLLTKWKERAAERGIKEPEDLSSACKFVAAFTQAVEGGEIEANDFHTWVRRGGEIIDYTASARDTREMIAGELPTWMRGYATSFGLEVPENLYEPDPDFMKSKDFKDSMRGNQPRVDSWVEEWRGLQEDAKKGWLLEALMESAPRTLYHGTLKEYLPEIEQSGLVPTVGDFVSNFYAPYTDDEDYDPEVDSLEPLVFAASKNDLQRCVNAIRHRLQAKGIKPTPEAIIEHGAIIVIKDEHEEFYHHDEQPYDEHPTQVEPRDFYSYEEIVPTFILMGRKLKDLLRRRRIEGFWSPRPPIR